MIILLSSLLAWCWEPERSQIGTYNPSPENMEQAHFVAPVTDNSQSWQ